MLWLAIGSAAELRAADRRKEVLGLREWLSRPAHGNAGQSERPDLLSFAARGWDKLRPGAEAATVTNTWTAAHQDRYPAIEPRHAADQSRNAANQTRHIGHDTKPATAHAGPGLESDPNADSRR